MRRSISIDVAPDFDTIRYDTIAISLKYQRSLGATQLTAAAKQERRYVVVGEVENGTRDLTRTSTSSLNDRSSTS